MIAYSAALPLCEREVPKAEVKWFFTDKEREMEYTKA